MKKGWVNSTTGMIRAAAKKMKPASIDEALGENVVDPKKFERIDQKINRGVLKLQGDVIPSIGLGGNLAAAASSIKKGSLKRGGVFKKSSRGFSGPAIVSAAVKSGIDILKTKMAHDVESGAYEKMKDEQGKSIGKINKKAVKGILKAGVTRPGK